MTLAEIRAKYLALRSLEADEPLLIPLLVRFHGHEMTHLWWPGAWPRPNTACGQVRGEVKQRFIGPGLMSRVTCWGCKMSGRELGFTDAVR